MSAGDVDTTHWLSELTATLPAERSARVRAFGEPREVLSRLVGAVESLVLTDAPKCIEVSDMLVALVDALAVPALSARARRCRGQALAYAGRLAESLELCEQAVAIAEGDGQQLEAARARLACIHPLAEMGRYDEALTAGAQARSVFVASGESKLAAHADVNLGGIHRHRDEPEAALEHFDRARTALADEPLRVGWIDSNRGEALLQLHDFAAAQAAFESSLRTSSQAGAALPAAIAEGNLADLAARRGDLQSAVFLFERARSRLEESAATSHLARLIAEQAEAYESLGLYEAAQRAFEDAVPRLESLRLVGEGARARAALGRTLLQLGHASRADDELAEAARQLRALGHTLAAARVDLIRTEVALRQAQPAVARQLVEDVRAELSQRPADEAALRLQSARLALRSGDLPAAALELTTALRIAQELGMSSLVAAALQQRAALHRAANRPLESIADLRAAIALVESTRGSLRAERFRASFLGEWRELYEELARGLLAGPHPSVGAALTIIEQAKSRALLDTMHGAESPADDPSEPAEASLADEFQKRRGELNALLSQRDDDPGAPARAKSQNSLRSRIDECERALEDVETRLASLRRGRPTLGQAPSLEAVLACLPRGAEMIEYFSLGGELCAFVLRADAAPQWCRICDLASMRAQVRRTLFQIGRAARPGVRSTPRAAQLTNDARRELLALHDLVWRPLAPLIADGRRLILAPHDALHLAPLHALWDGDRHLAQRHDVSYVPSAGVLRFLAERRRRATGSRAARALVVGVADERAQWIAQESRVVAQILGGAHCLADGDATVKQFCDLAGQADVIHLACHGRFSAQSPLSSGLRLADRWLTLRDLRGLRLQAELVTLSGCETGRASVSGADELQGFLRGFIAAGAQALLVSLWPVDDEATCSFMSEFYREWRSGGRSPGDAAAAAARAQRAALSACPHPTFWAPFVFVGDI